VTTDISVTVSNSEDAAANSGAQNVVGLTNGSVMRDGSTIYNGYTESGALNPGSVLGGSDRAKMDINTIVDNRTAAHEFGHLLGIGHISDGNLMQNSYTASRPRYATREDFANGLGGATSSHRVESTRHIDYRLMRGGVIGPRYGGQPRSYQSTRTLKAPFLY
jgi:matrixin